MTLQIRERELLERKWTMETRMKATTVKAKASYEKKIEQLDKDIELTRKMMITVKAR